ncbi:Mitogen-activated protein kinase kinase kinase 18 [Camellia lanceoleosa]|uniref:Mitogen-activated protein kinase kinase kinase 18 n=1 Tax=Camellia lanceoleosa TaxID=1840588 RepID=A0ACC0F3G5_9ERIC|nr:Mitogen-activated protein kinase kinase kinase 18 [Camellia lanceoleosa]
MENLKRPWVRGSCIGRGSYGTVSLAVNKSDGQGKVFAVKSVDLSSCLKPQADALENEIRILRSLSSPWVVEYLGADSTAEQGSTTSFRNLHLEYLPGGTVADLAKRYSGADVDEEIVRSYTWCVVSALKYVHAMGIVHCDVKGKNVLVGPTHGGAKLADFGSAAEISAASPPCGSPLWMAPEVIRREYQGPESDVWSLGCTVIEMVTGKPAWEDHGGDTLCKIGYSDELPEIPTQLSELGRDFLHKCLRRDRTQRWSCDQLLRHPFVSSSSPSNSITHQSPRCVLDWLNSEFSDEEKEEDESSLEYEIRAQSGRGRIGKLASNEGPIWESDGWVVVRNVSTDETAAISEPSCCCGDEEEEGTSSEYLNFTRTEQQIENFDFGGDGDAVEWDGGGWLRRWAWAVVTTGSKGITAGVIFLLLNSLYLTAIICILVRFIIILHYILFTFYLRLQSVHVTPFPKLPILFIIYFLRILSQVENQ